MQEALRVKKIQKRDQYVLRTEIRQESGRKHSCQNFLENFSKVKRDHTMLNFSDTGDNFEIWFVHEFHG